MWVCALFIFSQVSSSVFCCYSLVFNFRSVHTTRTSARPGERSLVWCSLWGFAKFSPVKRLTWEFFLSRCEGLKSEDVVMVLCKALWDKLFVKIGMHIQLPLHTSVCWRLRYSMFSTLHRFWSELCSVVVSILKKCLWNHVSICIIGYNLHNFCIHRTTSI